ncbi:hypothetical protein GB928_027660 [Shinella curvata]|uniref:Uncharacterized protein n=1 Tax=Shinella curvata TaxID=1817964 RepID=A0ABT8XML9_9HYPH|nr:hypothetical protein [Shinella curvata]MCJ8057188.1 hypothetical protein [Shinella curvata]MDO6124965.1 hypothetical protein [Shinella curvata]
MHRLEVARWGLEHGFSRETPYTLEASYGSFVVRMMIGYQFLTTMALHQTSEDILARVPYSELFVDDNDMLHGAGLNSEFINRMIRGQPAPLWFPESHKLVVETHLMRPPSAVTFGQRRR